MPYGAEQFTPRQLLDAGRYAEAEGKPALAHQFYRHLADIYAETAEAAEGRSRLARLDAQGLAPQVWRTEGEPGAEPAPHPRRAGRAVGVGARRRSSYRTGRALAALLGAIGWAMMAAAAAWLAAGVAAEHGGVAALQDFRLSYLVAAELAAALLGGAVIVVCGQAARALFDQARDVRELLALERARAGGERP